MTVDINILDQSIQGGNWFLIPAVILSIGFSAAFSLLILKMLLDLHHITIPSRFTTDSPETFFERAWMANINTLTLLFQGFIRAFFMIVGFTGALLVCCVALNWIAGRDIIRILGAPQKDQWLALGLTGGIPMLAALMFSSYTQDKAKGKAG
jgi:hypothetical protein